MFSTTAKHKTTSKNIMMKKQSEVTVTKNYLGINLTRNVRSVVQTILKDINKWRHQRALG